MARGNGFKEKKSVAIFEILLQEDQYSFHRSIIVPWDHVIMWMSVSSQNLYVKVLPSKVAMFGDQTPEEVIKAK